MVDSGDVIREIESVRFTPVRMRVGYDMGEVDELLDQLVAAAREGRALAGVIAGAAFSTVRLREGYEIDEVDAFLEKMTAVTPVPDERARLEAAASPAARELAARIREVDFHPVLLREGYPPAEVDRFLDALVDAALEGRPLLPLLDSVVFTRGRFRHGYAPEEVDQFLRALASR